ncbi:hypothetical protein TNCV_2668831 [Trichonephila clavipes]|nr:hypothetical protein TNCV_2668831 [Trichonephila clavipes]
MIPKAVAELGYRLQNLVNRAATVFCKMSDNNVSDSRFNIVDNRYKLHYGRLIRRGCGSPVVKTPDHGVFELSTTKDPPCWAVIDEAHFWLNGYVNIQNCRIWSEANPQVYVETPLHTEKLTVWCALWAGGILLQKR